jgi:hypothetical protein
MKREARGVWDVQLQKERRSRDHERMERVVTLLSVRMVELELEIGKLAARIARKLTKTRAGQECGGEKRGMG